MPPHVRQLAPVTFEAVVRIEFKSIVGEALFMADKRIRSAVKIHRHRLIGHA